MSWDAKNADALRKACAVCRREFYFTDHAQTICVRCREAAAKAERRQA